MVKRKVKSIIGGVRQFLTPPTTSLYPNTDINITQQDINKVYNQAYEAALKRYNASMFSAPKVNVPDNTYVAPIEIPIETKPKQYKKHISDKSQFVNDLYNSYYNAVRPGAASDEDADRQARFLTQKAALETGYGSSVSNRHNYGGHKTKKGWLSFDSVDDFTRKDVALLDKKWKNWRNSRTGSEFVDAINTNNGYGVYAPDTENVNYKGKFLGTEKRVNNYIGMGRRNLKCGGRIRPKAFLGAVIGAFGNVASGLIEASAKERMLKEQQAAENRRYYGQLAANMTNMLNSRDAQEAYENQYRMRYKSGGRRKLRQGVEITDGGPFINSSTGRVYQPGDKLPVGTYDVLDYTHNEINSSGNTGNGMKAGNKKFEVEKNERVKVRPNSVLVLSDSMKIPTPYGIDTPANAERNGVDNTYVERIQQSFNGNYGGKRTRRRLRDIVKKNNLNITYPSMYMENGGYISHPVERIKAEDGIIVRNGRRYKRVNYKNSDGTVSNNSYLQDIGPAESNWWENLKNKVNSVLHTKMEIKDGKLLAVRPGETVESAYNRTLPNGSQSTDSQPKNVSGGGVRGTNYTTWVGRDGNTYYGTRSKNRYNVKGTVSGNYGGGVRGINSNSQNSVSPGSNKANRFVNVDVYGGQPVDEIVVTGNSSKPSAYALSKAKGNTRSLIGGSNKLANRGSNRKAIDIGTFTAPAIEREITQTKPAIDIDVLRRDLDPYNGLSDNQITRRELGVTDGPAINTMTTPRKPSSNIDYGNIAGGILNAGGALLSGILANNALDNTYIPKEPVPVIATSLPTTSSNGNELAEIDRMENRMLKDARDNISSSADLVNRRNMITAAMNDRRNTSWDTRRKREIEMLTKDALNQQSVDMFNAQRRDEYEAQKGKLSSTKNIYKASNISNMIGDIVGAYNDYDAQLRQNRADEMMMNWYLSTLGDKDRDWFINRVRNRRNGFSIV